MGLALVKAAESRCSGDKECEQKTIDDGIKGYNDGLEKYGTPQVIVLGVAIAAPIALEAAIPAISACLGNPLLCLNSVGTFSIELIGADATSMGLMAGVGCGAKLTQEEIKILAEAMKKDPVFAKKRETAAVDQVKAITKDVIYDAKYNTLTVLKKEAGKGR
ncbi:hypothetical protein RHO14_07730 [Orbus wheelerorum]|uniref:hypothetical protein n=1 Tax=Orbus wheelerorum TaxID=3074111 RepID=UPI00370DBDB9